MADKTADGNRSRSESGSKLPHSILTALITQERIAFKIGGRQRENAEYCNGLGIRGLRRLIGP